jgi:hypothetical protein
MDELRAIECVGSGQEAERLEQVVGTLPPAPEVLQHLFAIQEASSGENGARVAEIIEAYARHYETLLTPLYHVVPWGDLVIDRDAFLEAYQSTRDLLPDFASATADEIARVLLRFPPSLMVFRLMTGYTWNELSDIVRTAKEVRVSGQKIRSMERAASLADIPGSEEANADYLRALAEAIHGVIEGGIMRLPEDVDPEDFRTRQHKVDTRDGWKSVERCAAGGVGYADLLYERYTGRPFAYVRDALSERKGDVLEEALVALFEGEQIPYERVTDNTVEGWPQAPDFFLPDRTQPEVALESKIAEDGGTARDKASRIERLARMCRERDVLLIAAIDGKGFRRFGDVMLPIIRNTRGHTYTLQNLDRIADVERVQKLRRRQE